jgi:hypothetical protein
VSKGRIIVLDRDDLVEKIQALGYGVPEGADETGIEALIDLRAGLIHHPDRGSQGGFNRSLQHGVCRSVPGTRQAPPLAFSS